MNYTQYLQNGAELAQPEVENRLGEQEVNQLVLRIAQGDQEAAAIFVENAVKDPENAWITDALQGAQAAAEQGDESAVKFLEVVSPLLQQAMQTQSLKCGGKVRTKIKKASCGKKLEKGAKVPVEKKGGCPCQYRRVGGRIQLVDCNGIPVAKNGAILKADNGIVIPDPNLKPEWMFDLEKHRDPLLDGMIAYSNLKAQQAADKKAAELNQQRARFASTFNGGGVNYGYKNPFDVVKESTTVPTYYNPYTEMQLRAAATNTPIVKAQSNFGAGKPGKFGGLTYDEAVARQREMQAAKDKGFIVDLGRWGVDGKWGKLSSSEWERYQLWKEAQAIAAAREENARLQALTPATSNLVVNKVVAPENPFALTRDNRVVNFNNISAGRAIWDLNNPGWKRYMNYVRVSKNGSKMPYADYLK